MDLAMLISGIGVISIALGFELNLSTTGVSTRIKLPSIRSIFISKRVLFVLFLLSLFQVYIRITTGIPQFLGTIEGLINLLPIATIFFISRLNAISRNRTYNFWAITLLVIETTRALLFDYLRLNILLPSIAYLLGYLTGYSSIRSFLRVKFLPVYVVIGFFISYFTLFGENRAYLSRGVERVDQLQELAIQDTLARDNTLIMRFSNFNQLTNVVQVVKEDGFDQGASLEYLKFALVPRFIWPDKPLIQPGAWFAYRIGRGYIDYQGRYRNAINTTAYGELYMNYGWFGVLAGGLLFGFIISLFWSTTHFWDEEDNFMGSIFGYYLLFLGLYSFGANLSILVTILAMYLLILFISFLLKNLLPKKG